MSPRYRRMVRRWQKVPKIRKPRFREGFRDLTVYAVNLGKRIRVFPYLPDGSLDPDAINEFQSLFKDKDSGKEHPIHPRLIKLLYKLADRFKARQINLISGFREGPQEKSEGKHTRGLAADIMIPGVSLGAVARAARRFGHVGVGFYPRSGFIHLDIRDGPSFFWVDRSGPGKPGCLRRIMAEAGAKFDRRWKPKKDEPKRHVNRKGKPLGAIKKPDPVSVSDERDVDKEARPPL
ncbi:MAG: YcbK family protein [Deltaproteobacteria bacterium]|nr:YcbK family protein [Deltaproteobacteria bacterium]